MENDMMKIPPKPALSIKTNTSNSSRTASSFSNGPEYINVKAESAPPSRSLITSVAPPAVLPKKITGLKPKPATSSQDLEKREYINVQTTSTITTTSKMNVLPLSPKKSLLTARVSGNECINVQTPPGSRSSPSDPSLAPNKTNPFSPTTPKANPEYINVQKTNDSSIDVPLPLSPKPSSASSSVSKASRSRRATAV